LMRKDFIAITDCTKADVLAADFPKKFAATCKTAGPLVKFLAESLGLQY
ncbi:MAG: TIGR02453 family protein, partial [Gemmatimonadetes bacterium]|nr:TIGR02453 family protein [Gemmatimonadota bacterium]